MTGVRAASTTAMPKRQKKLVKRRPSVVVGQIEPYPTVVAVTVKK